MIVMAITIGSMMASCLVLRGVITSKKNDTTTQGILVVVSLDLLPRQVYYHLLGTQEDGGVTHLGFPNVALAFG